MLSVQSIGKYLVSSSVIYEMRSLLHQKRNIELSKYKGIHIVKIYLVCLWKSIEKSAYEISKILNRLFGFPQKNRRKSHKNRYMTANDIIKALP